MKMTVGTLLYWGGICGLAAAFVMLIVILIYLRGMRKKMQENLEKNY